MRTLRYVLWGLVLVVTAMTAGVFVGRHLMGLDAGAGAPNIAASFARAGYQDAGGPFRLIDTEGNTVTEADFAGTPRVMFFGFTHCPDVCPTALLDADRWLDKLGDSADDLTVIFVSVDPERDTPELLRQYVKAFDERIVGLTAPSEDAIAAMADDYGVRFEKVPLNNGDYTINHTADTLLFDGEGNYVDFIPYLPPNMRAAPKVAEAEEERTMAKLRDLVGG